MNVLLVNPFINSVPLPNLGLSYIASVLRKNHELSLIDLNIYNNYTQKVRNILKGKSFDAILISASFTPNHKYYLDIIKLFNEYNNLIIIGGVHATNISELFLSKTATDIVVRGEGEKTIFNLLKAIERHSEIDKIEGISYKQNNLIKHNISSPFIKNLDDIPPPSRDLLPMNFYDNIAKDIPSLIYKGRPVSWIFTSRGCPYECIFCATKTMFGRSMRYHSIEHVMTELKILIEKYNLDHISFLDDVFTYDRNRLIELCKQIISEKLDIVWRCNTRVDKIDKEILKIMGKAGCSLIEYGVESTDIDVLKQIKKGITLKQINDALKKTKEMGIPMQVDLMFGNVGDSIESIERTLQFGKILLKKFDAFPSYWISIPYPGTELYNKSKRKGLIKTYDYSNYYFTPTREYSIENRALPYVPEDLNEKFIISKLKSAWIFPKNELIKWLEKNQILERALKFYKITFDDYLDKLFQREIGNFLDSTFFLHSEDEKLSALRL